MMKPITKNIFIWGIWSIVLLIISICFSLQSTQNTTSLIMKLPQDILFCSIPYIFFTVFYLRALVTKQFSKIICILLIDIVSVAVMIGNFGYFYEGATAGRNLLIVVLLLMLVKGIILIRRRNKSIFITDK